MKTKSWMEKKQLGDCPGLLVATSNWPVCLPTWSKVVTLAGITIKLKVIPA